MHNGHSRYQNLNLTCWFLVSGVKITSIWGLSIHYFINLVIFSSKITISKSNFLDDCPNHIYLYTLESYIRHQKISISQNPSKSAVRDYDQMKNMPKAAMVVHEILRWHKLTDVFLSFKSFFGPPLYQLSYIFT